MKILILGLLLCACEPRPVTGGYVDYSESIRSEICVKNQVFFVVHHSQNVSQWIQKLSDDGKPIKCTEGK